MVTKHQFGGDWTEQKLAALGKYLPAYAKIMKKQKFRFAYIDAFAGTGYRSFISSESGPDNFPGLSDDAETRKFLDGSASSALRTEPKFDQYIFIEKNARRYRELEKLKEEFRDLRDSITLINSDANKFLQDLCEKRDWRNHRAVLFLDPYGMQVSWDTVKAIASTQAIDLWYLFPLGMAVNRMLTKNGRIDDGWRKSLDKLFGTTGWFAAFYEKSEERDMFTDDPAFIKTATSPKIRDYLVARLGEIFPAVAPNPLELKNSRGTLLYLLCFAAANKTALKIAKHILSS